MDPLSDVLSLVKPRSYRAGGFTAGGNWAIQYPKYEGIKCYTLVEGACTLVVDGVGEPLRVECGDCLLLPSGRPFRLGSDAKKTRAADAAVLFRGTMQYNGIRALAPGNDFFLIGGHFLLDGNADLLLQQLPPIVHIGRDSARATMRWCVERMMTELRDPQPGAHLVAQQVSYTMLVQVLRLYLANQSGGIGWLAGLADRQISTALGVMHQDPARGWTIRELAAQAGMSRSTFAERFKATVGSSPMEYLTRWRMQLAADRLHHTTNSVAEIARALGYDSESAFSAAFKRVMGQSPRRYAEQRRFIASREFHQS